MELARRCAGRDPSEAGFANCVLAGASVKLNLDRLKKTSVPRTAFVSQIYEEDYDLDPDLHFLHPQHDGNAVWPLRFTVQMTVNDEDRIEFPQFRGTRAAASTRLVLNGIRAKGDSAVLDDLRNFTLLQRFFRAALAGNLGQNFPIEKLTDFARSTRTPNESCSTPRWINRKKLAGESAEQAIGLELRQLPATASFTAAAPKPLGDQVRARFSACSPQ